MTLPDERVRAVKNTRQFLRDLLDSNKTPRVPRYIRLLARQCLKHYPGEWDYNDIFNEKETHEKHRDK